MSQSEIDYLIDCFVDTVNTSSREPVYEPDTPPSVFLGEPEDDGSCDWRIKPLVAIDWVETLEARLPFRIPAVYHSLVARYIFPAFELGDIYFFANTPEGTAFHEFRARIFLDEHMSPKLLEQGFLQLGNPAGGGYDPVCFDMNRASETDAPVAQLDHEEILCNDRIVIVHEVAASLSDLIKASLLLS